jgi:hypothetical protein
MRKILLPFAIAILLTNCVKNVTNQLNNSTNYISFALSNANDDTTQIISFSDSNKSTIDTTNVLYFSQISTLINHSVTIDTVINDTLRQVIVNRPYQNKVNQLTIIGKKITNKKDTAYVTINLIGPATPVSGDTYNYFQYPANGGGYIYDQSIKPLGFTLYSFGYYNTLTYPSYEFGLKDDMLTSSGSFTLTLFDTQNKLIEGSFNINNLHDWNYNYASNYTVTNGKFHSNIIIITDKNFKDYQGYFLQYIF